MCVCVYVCVSVCMCVYYELKGRGESDCINWKSMQIARLRICGFFEPVEGRRWICGRCAQVCMGKVLEEDDGLMENDVDVLG